MPLNDNSIKNQEVQLKLQGNKQEQSCRIIWGKKQQQIYLRNITTCS